MVGMIAGLRIGLGHVAAPLSAAYVVKGEVEVAGVRFEAGRMLLFRAKDAVSLRAGATGARLLLGGAVMDGLRHLFWNFVSSSRERIEQAKADWKAGRFGTVSDDDKEFIPLPDVRVAQVPVTQVPAAGSNELNGWGYDSTSAQCTRYVLSMPDDTLSPATREDVLFALGYSLRFELTGKPHKFVDHQRLVEIQTAYLQRGGFLLIRKAGLLMPGVAPSR